MLHQKYQETLEWFCPPHRGKMGACVAGELVTGAGFMGEDVIGEDVTGGAMGGLPLPPPLNKMRPKDRADDVITQAVVAIVVAKSFLSVFCFLVCAMLVPVFWTTLRLDCDFAACDFMRLEVICRIILGRDDSHKKRTE